MPPKGEKRSRQSCLGLVSEDEAADPKKSRPQKAIFVKNLPPNVTEEQVMSLHSGIQKTKLEVAKNVSKTKYALLDFMSEESAKDAVQRINGMELDGYKLFVDYLESSAMVSYNQSDILSQGQDPLKLYVTGFGQNMTEHRLAELFPTASSFKLELHPQTKKSIGFAFIHFEDAAEAKRVHDSMQETMFDGRVLVVMHAKQDSTFEASSLKALKMDRSDEAEDCSEDEEEDDNDGDDDDDDSDSEFT